MILVKAIALLVGLAMLIGGGLCSASIPFLGLTKNLTVLISIILIAAVVIGSLIFLGIKHAFPKYLNYLGLLAGGLFLVGGGLCSAGSDSLAMTGLLLIDIAVTLCGYFLIRWVFTSKHKSSAE